MIFGKEYDDSLWLMMNGNKKVRDGIIYFFNRFPQELLIQIRESIKKYNEYVVDNRFMSNWDLYKDDCSGTVSCDSGLTYVYSVSSLGGLEIGEKLINGDETINLGYLSVYPFKKEEYENYEHLIKVRLGGIAEGYSYIDHLFYVPCNGITEVYLAKGFFNTNLVNALGFLTKYKEKYYPINIDKISDSYTLCDIEKSNKKKLVRKKY